MFRAADQPGLHRGHRCLKLTGIRLDDPAPPLRVVSREEPQVMPAHRRPSPTPALDALSGGEHASVLAELLTLHPELRPQAEDAARRLLGHASIEDVAESVAWALEELPLDALEMRSGRIRSRGYVHETEAAWQIVNDAVEPSSPTCEGAPAWAWRLQ